MSFPRANIKRFNDAQGCAPPVGSYDPKQLKKHSTVVIEKSDRFKAPKDVLPGPGSFDVNETLTPVKKLLNESVSSNSSNNGNTSVTSKPKKPDAHPSAENVKIKELEKEIRRLLLERANQDKQLVQREDEITKLEGRLHNAQLDKSSLQAKIATLDKEIKDAKKSNDLLKNKVATAESAGKRHEGIQTELSNLKQQYDTKEKEIIKLRQELNVSMATQLSNLSIYEENIISLEDKISELELMHQQYEDEENKENIGKPKESNTKQDRKQGHSTLGSTDSKRKNAENLQRRFSQAMKEYDMKIRQFRALMEERYNKVVDQQKGLEETLQQTETKLQSALKCSEVLQTYRDALGKQNRLLQAKIRELGHENWTNEDKIRFLKGEVSVATDNFMVESQKLFESNAEIAGLSETTDQLEEERNTLNENIKILTEKFQVMETTLAEEQSSKKAEIDKLESQLKVMRDASLELQVEFEKLQKKNKELVYSLNEEKEEVEQLTFQLSEQEQLNGDLKIVVEGKEELITDLEIQLEANKVEMQHLKEIAAIHAEEAESLKKKITDVEQSLRQQLQQAEEVHCKTAREHADRIFELENMELTLSEDNKKYEQENIRLESICQELRCEVKSLSEEIANVLKNSEIEILKIAETKDSEVKALESAIQDLQKEGDDSNVIIKEQTEKILDFEEIISKYRKEIASLEMKMEDVEGEFYEKVKFLECEAQKAEKLENDNLILRKKVDEKTNDMDNLEKQVKELDNKIADTQAQAKDRESDLISDYQRLTKELQEMTELRDTFEQKVCVVTEETTRLEAEVHKLEGQVQRCQSELETEQIAHTESSQELTSKIQHLEEQNKNSDDAIVTCRKKMDSLQVENDQLMKEIDYLTSLQEQDKEEIEKESLSFENRIKQLTEEKAQLFEKIGTLNDSKMATDVAMVKLKTELEKKSDELLCEKSVLSERVQLLDEQIKLLSNEKVEVSQQAEEVLCKLSELEIDNEQKNVEIDRLHSTLEETNQKSNSQIQMLESKIDALAEENSCLADQVGSSEQAKLSLKKEIESLESCVQNLKEQTEVQVKEAEEKIMKSSVVCQTLQETNNTLEEELEKLQQVVCQTKAECKSSFTQAQKAQANLLSEQQIRQTIETEFNQQKELCSELSSQMAACKERIERLETENCALKDAEENLSGALSIERTENQLLQSKVTDQQSFIEEQNQELEDTIQKHKEEVERLRNELQQSANSKEVEVLSAESERWQKMYEELQAKVQPFMEQLDAFEREKQALEGRSNFAQAEIEKLSAQYAKLLGHQNQKQKIHHIAKIKEENNHLKKEVGILREQCLKQKRSVQKLEDKISSLEGKKRFDPAKAFSHSKENSGPVKSPLKDGNRK